MSELLNLTTSIAARCLRSSNCLCLMGLHLPCYIEKKKTRAILQCSCLWFLGYLVFELVNKYLGCFYVVYLIIP